MFEKQWILIKNILYTFTILINIQFLNKSPKLKS